jgi:hypothetical protein
MADAKPLVVYLNYFRYCGGMRMVERQFSDFLRQPKDVVAEVVAHDVLLRRRNAPTLRLSQADRDDDRIAAFAMFAQVLRNLAAHNPGVLGDALHDAFPWIMFLPDADRVLFISELTSTLLASVDLGNFTPVAQYIREWRNTAEIYADPDLARRLKSTISNAAYGNVAAPEL